MLWLFNMWGGSVDPKLVKMSLLYKWIIYVMELGESNLQVMLRYRLEWIRPQQWGSQGPNLEWFTVPKYQSFYGSKTRGHITKPWHHMVKFLVHLAPRDLYGLLGSSIWCLWVSNLLSSGLLIPMLRNFIQMAFGQLMTFGHGT